MTEPTRDLAAGGRAVTASRGVGRLRRVLVVAQFAITTPLLIGAVLLLVSLGQLGRVNPGFDGV